MEADLTTELRTRIDGHLWNCIHCTAVYVGTRNVVQLLGAENALDLPKLQSALTPAFYVQRAVIESQLLGKNLM
jgi:hypothetical protein